MVVCHCRALTDRDVRAAIDDGARSVPDLARTCGAARDCGGCRFALKDLLADAPVCPPQPARHDGPTVTAAA
jgi:bacterioferritin-associated ferredoxin